MQMILILYSNILSYSKHFNMMEESGILFVLLTVSFQCSNTERGLWIIQSNKVSKTASYCCVSIIFHCR